METMNLPKVITDLVEAQNNFDSVAYANCFSETGVMLDEGKTHTGRVEIKHCIDESNKKYRSVMKPLEYIENGNLGVLSAECSGTFPGSPLVLKFHFEIVDGQIQHLNVTD
jgi:hypothetical protein